MKFGSLLGSSVSPVLANHCRTSIPNLIGMDCTDTRQVMDDSFIDLESFVENVAKQIAKMQQ